MYKKAILLIVSIFNLSLFASAQKIPDSTIHIRDIAWTTPVKKNTTINGLALGLFEAIPWQGAEHLKINGVNTDVSFFGVIMSCYALVGTIATPFSNSDTTNKDFGGITGLSKKNIFPLEEDQDSFPTIINGLSLSFGGLVEARMNGLAINGGISFADAMTGVEITGVMNFHYSFKGVMIAGLRNKVTQGKGVQIALFNSCKKGQVFQIGLLNRIGKRTTPIINFRFKKD
jgi:hypothetical protein